MVKTKTIKKTAKKPISEPIPDPEIIPEQPQLSGADIIKSMKNSIRISLSDAEENIIKIFDQVIAQIAAAAQQINKQAAHINALETFLKANNIPLDAIIPTQAGQKGPNRETRRKISKVADKHKKSKKA